MKDILNRIKRSQVDSRDNFDSLIRTLAFRRSYSRRKAAREIQISSPVDVEMFKNKGLVNYKSDYLEITPLLDEVYSYCQGLLAANAMSNNNKSGKDYLQHLVRREDFDPSSPVVKLAFNKELVGQVASFLNDFPVIADIALLYSPPASSNTSSKYTGSQLFHMDADDTALCKVWFLLEDVSVDDGPTVVVCKASSRRLARQIGYHKSSRVKNDELITKDLTPGELFTVLGKKKDLIFIDTANCFHYGSRVEKVSKGRFMLMISYSTSFAMEHGFTGSKSPLKLYPTNLVDSNLNSKFRRMLVDSCYF